MSAEDSPTGTLRALQLLIVGSIVAPVLIFASGGYLNYESTVERAKTELSRNASVIGEQLVKVLDTDRLMAARAADLLRGMSDDDISHQEAALHDQLARYVDAFPQIRSIFVIGKNGRTVVASNFNPVDSSIDFSDRDYFRALRDEKAPIYMTAIDGGRINQASILLVAVPKKDEAGEFNGVILLSSAPDYFGAFYEKLLGVNMDHAINVAREDGTVLVRYSAGRIELAPPRAPRAAQAAAQQVREGFLDGVSPVDGVSRLIAFRRLDAYPIYVGIGQTTNSIMADWRESMGAHLYFGVPATLCLFSLSLFAYRRTQREQEAQDRAREATRKREIAENALRQVQKMEAVGQLTGGIAHDFNNILTVILGALQALQRTLNPDDAQAHRLSDMAKRAAERAATLTQQLLAFSRRQPLEPKPLEVNRLVAGMSDLLQRTLGERIGIETVLAGGLWRISADANQLEAALLNLAVNARDAMPSGGKLTIETANASLDDAYAAANEDVQPGQYVMIAVSDTGTGMTREAAARAFEPFFTTKEIGRGTGLGLSQVYGFLKQSGGHVKIYSELGQGTTVKLYMPRLRGAETAGMTESAVAEELVSAKGKILIVEDDEAVRTLTADLLRDLGYEVVVAEDGHIALQQLLQHPDVDLLFTDVGLPNDMNGRQLADEAVRRMPGLRVLFTTGYARNAIVHHGRLDPGVELIAKPFSQPVLAEKIRRILADDGKPA